MQIQHKLSSENVAYLNVDFLLCEDDVHVGGLLVGGNGMGVEMNSIQCPCLCKHSQYSQNLWRRPALLFKFDGMF